MTDELCSVEGEESMSRTSLTSILRTMRLQFRVLESEFFLLVESKEGTKLRAGVGRLKSFFDNHPSISDFLDFDVCADSKNNELEVELEVDPSRPSPPLQNKCDEPVSKRPKLVLLPDDTENECLGSSISYNSGLPEDGEFADVVLDGNFEDEDESCEGTVVVGEWKECVNLDERPSSSTLDIAVVKSGGDVTDTTTTVLDAVVSIDPPTLSPDFYKESLNHSAAAPSRSKKTYDALSKRPKYRCELCDKTFGRRFFFENHRKYHREKETVAYACDLCQSRFKSAQTLKVHVRAKHHSSFCHRCDVEFEDSNELVRHYGEKHPDRLKRCSFCPKAFLSARSLSSHVKAHMRKDEKGPNAVYSRCTRCTRRHDSNAPCLREMSCQKCGKSFARRSHLLDHMLTHSGDSKPYLCKLCESRFKMKRALTMHVKAVHDKLDLICEICKKAFHSIRYLKAHARNIHGERKFACCFCDKAFAHSAFLKVHLKTHSLKHVEKKGNASQPVVKSNCLEPSGEEDSSANGGPFLCLHCNQGFIERDSRQEHVCVGSPTNGFGNIREKYGSEHSSPLPHDSTVPGAPFPRGVLFVS